MTDQEVLNKYSCLLEEVITLTKIIQSTTAIVIENDRLIDLAIQVQRNYLIKKQTEIELSKMSRA